MNEGGVCRVGKPWSKVAQVGRGEVESKVCVALQVFVAGHRVVGNVPNQFRVLETGSDKEFCNAGINFQRIVGSKGASQKKMQLYYGLLP